MPSPSPRPRRTQAERREATTGKLVDATIACLAELGYAKTSVSAICGRAGVSQGALFRHFPTRADVIVAAADEITRRHLARFSAAAPALRGDALEHIVVLIRALARTDTHAAWREIMVAARTDPDLRDAAAEGLQSFEQRLIDTAARFLGLDTIAAERVAVVLLSVMHMFDSEAVTVTVYANERLEAERVRWATQMLQRELAALAH